MAKKRRTTQKPAKQQKIEEPHRFFDDEDISEEWPEEEWEDQESGDEEWSDNYEFD